MTRRTKILFVYAAGLIGLAAFLWGAVILARGPALLAGASRDIGSAVEHAMAISTASYQTEPAPPEPVKLKTETCPPTQPFSPAQPPEWKGMQAKKMSVADECFPLRGISHNILKCWSHELIENTTLSRYLYYIKGAP